jgi:hypothetical protein
MVKKVVFLGCFEKGQKVVKIVFFDVDEVARVEFDDVDNV